MTNRSIPPLRALVAFRAAATHSRLVDAAETLGVSESAVSHQIRSLESFLRVKLFDRTALGLRLTAAGAEYLARIDPALSEIVAATEAILPPAGRTRVRLTLPPSLAATWLVPRLGDFERRHPGIDLQVVATTRLIDLARDGIDAAIRYGRGRWDGVEADFLFEDLATPVAAPGLIDDPAAPPEAVLAKTRIIVNRSIPEEWTEWAKARGLEPPRLDDALVLDAIEQVLQVAESGHGIAMGRSPYIEPRLERGTLVAPFGAVGPTGAAYYFCRPAGVTPPSGARQLERWIKSATGPT